MREFVVQRKRWLSRSNNGTALPIPREVVEAGPGPSNTHTRMHAGCSESKKKVKIMPHPDGPSRQGPPSFCWMCGFWSCAAGTALYPDSGMRPGSPGQAD